ncbi:FxLYD domain-containing protein [Streptomyces sp. NPDC002889]|uniref:FxLYD domain-containing protein n=1 Tax=Streptomyces sp. NPDC002889 TaxID=3364669 RepID=UPI003682AB2D
MASGWIRRVSGAVLAAVVAVGAAGCSDDGSSPSDTVSKAASAVESAGSALASAASQAPEVLASATAEAHKKLDSIKGGVDARDEVTLGDPSTDADGRSTVDVSARNTDDTTRSFAVQVNFEDKDGNLLDTVVVTIADVPAGKTGRGTARSKRKMSGDITVKVGSALRY